MDEFKNTKVFAKVHSFELKVGLIA